MRWWRLQKWMTQTRRSPVGGVKFDWQHEHDVLIRWLNEYADLGLHNGVFAAASSLSSLTQVQVRDIWVGVRPADDAVSAAGQSHVTKRI